MFRKLLVLLISVFLSLEVIIVYSQSSLTATCEAGGPYVKNSTVNVVGDVTNNTEGVASNIEVNITKNSTTYASRSTTSDSSGRYYVSFVESLDIGNYSVNVTAEKDGEYGYCSDNLEIRLEYMETCVDRNIQVSGMLIYSTGELVGSGTITASVIEADAKNQDSFTAGEFSITIPACIYPGRRYSLSIIIEDGLGGRSYSQIFFVAT
jgi:hypothetical protein